MSPEHEDVPNREERLSAVLVACLEAIDRGEMRSREELRARYPEFADEVNQFLEDQERVARCAAPLRAVAAVVAKRTREGKDSSDTVAAVAHAERTAALRRLGDYELLDELGHGGMATVYRARQGNLGRTVAVKVIRAADGASRRDAERFRREAELAAHLDHPQIVPVYEVGEHDGHVYFSMKLIEGGSLAMCLNRFTPDPRAAGQLVALVARAVHHAHQRGVLHRDLKPANILLDEAGQPHITDFGLARRVEGDSSLTQSGALVGTPSYMAPEQTAGERAAVTTAADVYGLGATLYALLTGRPPFRADTAVDTMLLVREQEPESPRRSNGRVHRDLETICLKCLQKDPQRRYGSAAALAEDLERWLKGESIQGRRAGLRERFCRWVLRRPALAALVVLSAAAGLALVGGVIWHNAQLRAAAEQARQERDAAEEERRWARQAVEDMYTQVAEKWLQAQPRLSPVQREFLEKALRYYTHEATQDAASPGVQAQVAAAQYRLGKIYSRLGRAEEARQALKRAIALFERLTVESPADAQRRLDLAKCYYGLGTAAQRMGRHKEAVTAYQHSIAVIKAPSAAVPDSPDLITALVSAQDALAMSLAETGKVTEAEHAYREAINLGGRMVKKFPTKHELRATFANIHNNLGNLLYEGGRPRKAEPEYREAARLLAKLAEDMPTEADYRERWAFALSNRALALVGTTRLREAQRLLSQAAALQKRLADDFPAVPDYQWELVASQGNLGITLRGLRNYAGAEKAFSQSLAISQKLVTRYPAEAAYRHDMAKDERNLANLLGENLHRPKEAEKAYRRAVGLETKLAAQFPSVPAYRSELAGSYADLGDLLGHTSRLREAVEAYTQALKLQEALTTAAPNNRAFRAALARSCARLAWLLVCAEAPPCPETARAVALAKRAVQLSPKEGASWFSLGAAQYRVGNSKECLAALEQASQLGYTDEKAREWYADALRSMGKNSPNDQKLLRFRAKAAALLGRKLPKPQRKAAPGRNG